MHEFSRQNTFLENLLLSIIRANPVGENSSVSDNARLTDALFALTGEGLGTGSVALDDEAKLVWMASELKRETIYMGPFGQLLPERGRPDHLKKGGKKMSARELARTAAKTQDDNAESERLRKKFKKEKGRLLAAQSVLGDEDDIQKGFEYNAVQETIEILKRQGIAAEMKDTQAKCGAFGYHHRRHTVTW